MAARAGLPLQDQEFVQFHPTGQPPCAYGASFVMLRTAAAVFSLHVLQQQAMLGKHASVVPCQQGQSLSCSVRPNCCLCAA